MTLQLFKLQQYPTVPQPRTQHRCRWLWVVWFAIAWLQNTGHMLSSSDQSHGPWRGAKPCYSHEEELNVPFMRAPGPCVMLWDLTCVSGCPSPAHSRSAALTAAGGCWSTGRDPWRWWPYGWSPTPARTRWNSGWRKYCALPAMRNKEINKKAKAPLMRRSAQLDHNRL